MTAFTEQIPQCYPEWSKHYRIIPSKYPTINFFEDLVEPELMDTLFELEAMTNDRLRNQVGDIQLVKPEDRLCGPGSTPVMAAFTHISEDKKSRFSDGSYGVYYAGNTLETAICETSHHMAQFLAYTQEAPAEFDMRVYIGELQRPLYDIRDGFDELHSPTDWSGGQQFGLLARQAAAWGLLYNSVRNSGGECIAVFRPPAITIPRQGPHLSYVWDGEKVAHVYHKRLIY